MLFRPSGKFRGHPVLYRDHRKGPGGPPGGATYPRGPRGLKWEGNQPLVGWCARPWALPAPRVGNPRWGGHHLPWGALHPPLGRRPLGRLHLPGPAPPLGAYIKKGKGEGRCTLCLGASLPLLHLVLLPQQLGDALPEFCCIHHHAVVLLDHHQPLLSPCWIKK